MTIQVIRATTSDDVVVIGDIGRVQRGALAGIEGTVTKIDGTKITLTPYQRASWKEQVFERADLWIIHPVPHEIACWYYLDENMNAVPTRDPAVFQDALLSKRGRTRTKLGRYTISTIFRGVPIPRVTADGNGIDWTRPLLWETLVSDPDEGPEVVAQYETYQEASDGHDKVVNVYRATGGPTGSLA